MFLPEKSHGQRSLVSYSPRVRHNWATKNARSRWCSGRWILSLLFGILTGSKKEIDSPSKGLINLLWTGPLSQKLTVQILVFNRIWSQANLIFSFNSKLYSRASLVVQSLTCLPAMWETRVRSLGREDPLEKEMAIHSSTLGWRIPWTEESGGLQSMGSHVQRVGHESRYTSKKSERLRFLSFFLI